MSAHAIITRHSIDYTKKLQQKEIILEQTAFSHSANSANASQYSLLPSRSWSSFHYFVRPDNPSSVGVSLSPTPPRYSDSHPSISTSTAHDSYDTSARHPAAYGSSPHAEIPNAVMRISSYFDYYSSRLRLDRLSSEEVAASYLCPVDVCLSLATQSQQTT